MPPSRPPRPPRTARTGSRPARVRRVPASGGPASAEDPTAPGTPGHAREVRPRRAGLTGRAAVLAVVVVALALTLAYPLRSYLGQRSDIAALREQVADREGRVAGLESARARWQDPAYVKAQARQRLHFELPGETQYVVLEPDEAPAATRPRPPAEPDRPWFTLLWQSVEDAAAPGRGTGAEPGTRP